MRARDLLSSGAPHDGRVRHSATELEEVPMPSIVGGLDIHRKQITFDYADTVTGEVFCGQIAPADRAHLRGWLAGRFEHPEDAAFAVEACTGWRYVTEELTAAGIAVHLAEPADTATQRGKKKRAKTDRADARLQRILLAQGRLPECWIPPGHVLECRALLELYHDLRTEHTAWIQRAHAVLFHQGAPVFCDLSRAEAPAELAGLSAHARVLPLEVITCSSSARSAGIDPEQFEEPGLEGWRPWDLGRSGSTGGHKPQAG